MKITNTAVLIPALMLSLSCSTSAVRQSPTYAPQEVVLHPAEEEYAGMNAREQIEHINAKRRALETSIRGSEDVEVEDVEDPHLPERIAQRLIETGMATPERLPILQAHFLDKYGYVPASLGGKPDETPANRQRASVRADSPGTHGALAVDRSQASYGLAVNMSSSQGAERMAIAKCGKGCTVVLRIQSGCAAYAVGDGGLGWGEGAETFIAEDQAIRECSAKGKSCIVKTSACSGK